MTLSLYARYLAERTPRGIVETEDGFATFEFVGEDTVYIVDLYVVPEKRKNHIASNMADKIVEESVKQGKKFLLGSVDVTAKGAEDSCKVLEAYGMRIHKVAEPMIFYVKEIAPIEEAKDIIAEVV